MKTIKIIFCIAIWLVCLSKLSQGVHDEDLISQMPQSTYDEIVDTLTTRNGFQPTDHQIVTHSFTCFLKTGSFTYLVLKSSASFWLAFL